MGARLDEELVPPAVKGLEALRAVDIVDENTTIGATVECNTQRLEALLPSGIPKLAYVSMSFA